MITTLPPAASPPRTTPALDLEARLALTDAAMNVRLDEAAIAFAVRTAHLPTAGPTPHSTEPVPPRLTPAAEPSPYSTPLASLLHQARARLETDGWCRDALFDESGAICPIRAIRLEAHGNRRLADDACVLLLDIIRRHFPDAETIPSWNAAQTSAAPVLLQLDRAAHHAHTRGL